MVHISLYDSNLREDGGEYNRLACTSIALVRFQDHQVNKLD